MALAHAGVTFREHAYEHDPSHSSFGLEAAATLGVDAACVFKTLLVAGPDGTLAVGIVPVESQLDLKAFAAAIGVKRVTMADPAVAERATGYVRGGISPIGQKRPLVTFLDASALRHDSIFVSGGRRGFEIELTAGDLLRVTDGSSAEIATPPR
ncbi:Cys-tRNA(Pro) deacylase [soil metagenome]